MAASADIVKSPLFWKMMPLTMYLGFETCFIFGAFPSAGLLTYKTFRPDFLGGSKILYKIWPPK